MFFCLWRVASSLGLPEAYECYGAKGRDRVKGLGFSFRFLTDQSIDDLAKRIKSHGGTMDLEPTDMPWGARAIRLTDPDGYKLSVFHPLKR
jgi:uncharacterized glyoxalase superfamily protein PhnB